MTEVVFLDTCVLYPYVLRDVILTCAERGLFQVRWSPDVLDELQESLSRKLPKMNVERLRATLESAFPDALISREQYQHLIPHMPNDTKDRHVLAAAIAARAHILVTANTRHFMFEKDLFDIDVLSPDEFLCYYLDVYPEEIFSVLEDLTTSRGGFMVSIEGILLALDYTVHSFSVLARKRYQEYMDEQKYIRLERVKRLHTYHKASMETNDH